MFKKGNSLCQTSELLLLIAMVEDSISNEAVAVPQSLIVFKLASCCCSLPFNNRETPKDKVLSNQTEDNLKRIINLICKCFQGHTIEYTGH